MHKLKSDDIGKRQVKIVDAETGETLATGVLQGLHYAVGIDRLSNESEARIALDIPDPRGQTDGE